MIADVILALFAASALVTWALMGRVAKRWLIIAGMIFLAALAIKGYYQYWRVERLTNLMAKIVEHMNKGEDIGNDLLKLRSDALAGEADVRVETWRTETMKWFVAELPKSQLDQFFGTIPMDIPHEKTIEYVRRKLDKLRDQLRQTLSEVDKHV